MPTTYTGTAAGLNGKIITSFHIGDQIEITDETPAAANVTISGDTLQYTGGSITIDNLGPGRYVIRAEGVTGTDIHLQEDAHNDFSGDGRSDILWQKDDGTTTDWLGQSNGNSIDNSANFFANAGAGWKIVGAGDFNGDGITDIMWQKPDGTTTDWLGNAKGGFTDNSANFFANAGAGWHIVAIGDFNGDGIDDIMWQKSDGTTTNWLGNAKGGFTDNSANFFANAGAGWQIVATGDFNGDGTTDIMWQRPDGTTTNWLGNTKGGFTDNSANFFANAGAGWHIVGTGDFNGDGINDILWRNDNGIITDWLGNTKGGFTDNSANFYANPGAGWHVVEIGDFNGDAIDDIMWQKLDGTTTNWLGQPNGSLVDNSAHFFANAGSGWHIIDPFIHDTVVG